MAHSNKRNENGMHSRVPLGENIRAKKPGRRKPSRSRKVAKEKKVEFIFLLATSATSLSNMNRKTTSPHTRRQSPSKKSPSKSLNSREQIFLFPNEFKKNLSSPKEYPEEHFSGYYEALASKVCKQILKSKYHLE